MYRNNLTGRIPEALGQLQNLERLWLFDNHLFGEIPESLGELTNLKQLWLYQNNLSGAVPASFANLNNLTDLRIQGNSIYDLPDLSMIDTLQSLNAENNNLSFEDLEPYVGLNTFTYQPQQKLDPDRSLSVAIRDSLILNYTFTSPNNQFQWYKDEQPIAGANGQTLVVRATAESDVGSFYLEITNDLLPDLTLTSGTIDITIGQTSVDRRYRIRHIHACSSSRIW